MAQLRFFPALEWLRKTTPTTLKADILAGLTNAAIVLHQGVAFATIVGLLPEYGLYTAMITAIIAALFGSSVVMVSEPTTAISALLFANLAGMAVPGTTRYIELVLLLTLLVGLFQIIAGLARLTNKGVDMLSAIPAAPANFQAPSIDWSDVAILTPSLSNSVGSCLQCYAGSGSFTRSGVNAEAGAASPLSAISARVRIH